MKTEPVKQLKHVKQLLPFFRPFIGVFNNSISNGRSLSGPTGKGMETITLFRSFHKNCLVVWNDVFRS